MRSHKQFIHLIKDITMYVFREKPNNTNTPSSLNYSFFDVFSKIKCSSGINPMCLCVQCSVLFICVYIKSFGFRSKCSTIAETFCLCRKQTFSRIIIQIKSLQYPQFETATAFNLLCNVGVWQ